MKLEIEGVIVGNAIGYKDVWFSKVKLKYPDINLDQFLQIAKQWPLGKKVKITIENDDFIG
jgi:hypothetical protein